MLKKYKRYFNLQNILIFILILIILFSISIKIFLLFNQPIGFNEGGLATIARGINGGKKLYIDLFEHKPPLAHYLLSFMFKITRTNTFSTHLLALILDIVLLLSIFFIAKKLYNLKVALLISALYSVLVRGVSYDIEIPMTLFGLIGIFLYIISFEKKNKFWPLFLSGFFIAVSVWFKQPGIFFFVAILIHQLFLIYKKEIKFKNSLKQFYIIIAGILVLSLPLLSYFIYMAGLHNFLYSIFVFNLKFSGSTSRIFQIGKFIRIFLFYFGIFLAITLSYKKEIFKEEYPRKNLLFGILTIILILFFLVNKEIFYNHLHQLIPFILLLSLSPLYLKPNDKTKKLILIILIVFTFSLFFQNLEGAARIYRDKAFNDQSKVGLFIKNNFSKNLTFFSDSPQYYFLSDFRPCSKYFLLAPSFNSVFDYSFLCSENSSDIDFMLLTHRKKYLDSKTLLCIKLNFQLIRRFENTGESYVEIWQRKK